MRTFVKSNLILACLVIVACGSESVPSTSDDIANESTTTYVISVDQTPEGNFSAVLPDGTRFHSLADYQSKLPSIIQEQISLGRDVRLSFGRNIARELGRTFGDEPAGAREEDGIKRSELYVGYGFNVTISSGWTYVSGCVKRNAYRVAIHLNHFSRQVFDLHLATYTQNGQRCYGAYESVFKIINGCTCNPVSYEKIKSTIYAAAIAAGLSAGIAALIAEVAAPAAIVALAI